MRTVARLRTRLTEGPGLPGLPENVTPEQIAKYREIMNVPEALADYRYEPPEGLNYEPTEFEHEMALDLYASVRDLLSLPKQVAACRLVSLRP